MASGLRHPYTGDLYEPDGPGRVRVTRRSGGEIGYFTPAGRWIDGARFDADLHLCGWVSAPRNTHRLSATPSSTATSSTTPSSTPSR